MLRENVFNLLELALKLKTKFGGSKSSCNAKVP